LADIVSRSGFVFAFSAFDGDAIRGPSPSLRTTARDARSGFVFTTPNRKVLCFPAFFGFVYVISHLRESRFS
jgi:hypothetical protein